MNLLPCRHVVFRSGLNAAEVSAKIRQHVKPRTAVSSARSTKEYEGEVSGKNFDIQRIIFHWNTFLPVITGTFLQEPMGTKVVMKIKLPPFVLIGVSVVAAFALIIFVVYMIATCIFSQLNFTVLIPLGFFTLLWLITIIPFNMECERSIKDFEKILETKKDGGSTV
jgi:hypothetical protein